MHKLLFGCLLSMSLSRITAQDSSSQQLRITVTPNVWMQQNFEKDQAIRLPGIIKNQRIRQQAWSANLDRISDNPLQHGALFFEVKAKFQYQNKVNLDIDLFAEQRGASYGLFDKSNLLLIPVFSIEARDTMNIGKNGFKLHGKAGYFLNDQLNEGGSIFNVDAEGWELGVEMDKWFLDGKLYSDFSNGIGLQLDDVYALSLKKVFGKKDSSCLGVSFAEYKKLYWQNNNYIGSLFGHTQINHIKLYAELSCRLDNTRNNYYVPIEENIFQKMSMLIGGTYNLSQKDFAFSTVFEARYFGAIFNEDYFDFRLRYRDANAGSYANTVGKFIYPLRKFETPFSQWSVYTEYLSSQVFSLNCRGTVQQNLGRQFFLHLAYDLNYIYAQSFDYGPESISSFVYPFFTTSINYRFIKEAELSLILTNKAMNLDISYPTHYLLTNPVLGLKLMTHF